MMARNSTKHHTCSSLSHHSRHNTPKPTSALAFCMRNLCQILVHSWSAMLRNVVLFSVCRTMCLDVLLRISRFKG